MPRESSPAKRLRGPDASPGSANAPRAGVASVLDVEILLHHVLRALDAPSITSFVEVLARNRQWLHCLQQPALWNELMKLRFGGPRVVNNDPDVVVRNLRFANVFLANLGGSDGETSEGDDEGEDEENEENEEGGEEEEEEEEEEEQPQLLLPELIPVTNAEISDERLGADEDTVAWAAGTDGAAESTAPDAAGAVGAAGAPASLVPAPAIGPATGPEPVSVEASTASSLVLSLACGGLKEFLLTAEEWMRFEQNVRVVQGDIGEITELDGHPIDGIAFPTTSFMRNPHIGSAAVVHRRAGDELTAHIRGLETVLNVSQVHVTPGFAAGVDKLIHVVGPSAMDRQCYQLLQMTYKSVMVAARRENLQCLAMASISTGNLGVPYQEGARMALRAIQRFLSQERWTGVVGFVCFEPEALDAFMKEKQSLVEAFNVVPPYPEVPRDMF